MHRIYRIVFNRTLGVPQVVSELAGAPGGDVIGTVDAPPKAALKSRLLAAEVGLALVTMVLPTWAQSCTQTSGTLTACTGSTGTNGGAANQVGGTPVVSGSGAGGGNNGAAGSGGAFGGTGGTGGTYVNAGFTGGGGGGVYGAGGAGGSGGGGAGGTPGVIATSSLTIGTGTVIQGGNGGEGAASGSGVGSGSAWKYGGGGGGGAAAIDVNATIPSLANAGSIVGGNGGAGAYAINPGGGGGGGMAVSLGSDGNQLANTGSIQGGAGGKASPGFVALIPGTGGGGGAGLSVTGSNNTMNNVGTITGGQGGTAPTSGAGGFGVAISGNNNTLISSGTISGGLDGNGANANYAVDITGSNNTLELQGGYSFTGEVFSAAGNGNNLALDGTTNASLDVGSLKGGFDSYQKNSSSSWTLTGTTALNTPWTILGGTLAISDDASLGAAAGALTISNGTLETTASTTSNRTVTLGTGTGTATFSTDAGTIYTIIGPVNGTGMLTKSGSGSLVLADASTYTGGTTISAGTLQIGDGGVAGTLGKGSVSNNANLSFNLSANTTVGNAINGAGQINNNGTGLITLSTASTNAANLTLNGGVAGIKVTGGLLAGSGHSYSFQGNVILAGTSGTTRVYASSASDTTLTFLSNATTLWVGSATLVNAPNIVVGSGVTVSEDPSQSSSDVYYNNLSGAGMLTLAGNGSVAHVLGTSAVQTLSMAGEQLLIGNGGAGGQLLSGNVSASNGLVLNSASSYAYAGVFSGAGGLTQKGTGTVSLTGANTYAGGTTISAGTLQLGNGGTTGSITGDVTDNGALAFDRSDAVTFDDVISGSGSLIKAGSGALTLSGTNSYTGGTTLSTGTLRLDNASAIGTGTLDMAEFTAIGFSQSFTLANDISLSGDPTVDVGSGRITTLSGGIRDGTQPGDLVKTGTGTLILTGVNTYTGATEVAAGTLDVQGSLVSSVIVDQGAILTGNGSTGGMTVSSGGMVTPSGSAIGTLTVNGDVSIASGASYEVNAADTGSSDLIHATGTATLGGSSVLALAAGRNWAASTRFTIVTGDTGVSGTFGTASSNFAFLTPTLSYDANHAYLTLARNAVTFPSVGITANQVQTAAAVEALGASNAVYTAVLPLVAGAARASFNNLAGDSLASTRTAIIDDSYYVRDAIENHLLGMQGSGAVSHSDAEGSAWSSTWGHGGHHDSNSHADAMHGNGSGLLVGADRDLGAWRVGAVAGLGQLSNRIDDASDAHSTSTVAGLYSGLDLGDWQLQSSLSHSWYRTDSHRTIDVPGIAGVGTASYHNGVTQAAVDGGYRFQLTRGSLTPYLNLARIRLHQDTINESGSAAALRVQADTSNVNYGTLGVRGVFDSTSGTQLYADLGFQHAWGDRTPVNRQRFGQGGITRFSVDGRPVAMNAGIVDAGVRFNVASNVTVDASYHGQFASDASDQGAKMALNVRF